MTDPAERIRRVRDGIAAENAKMPSDVDASGYSPGNRAGWSLPADANISGHPLAEPSHQGVRAGAEILAAAGRPIVALRPVAGDPPARVPVEALRSGAAPGDGVPRLSHQEQLEQLQREGRTLDALALINRPTHEARELGISVQQWHEQGYANRPPLNAA